MTEVTIYTDGACKGNPGPGGWAAILECRGVERVLSGGRPCLYEQQDGANCCGYGT